MRTTTQKFMLRKNRVRTKIARVSTRLRLSIFKSNSHLYAQVIDDLKSTTLVAASTLEQDIRILKKSNCNISAATRVGELLGMRALDAGITTVVFDVSGYKYHGVVRALADAARTRLEF